MSSNKQRCGDSEQRAAARMWTAAAMACVLPMSESGQEGFCWSTASKSHSGYVGLMHVIWQWPTMPVWAGLCIMCTGGYRLSVGWPTLLLICNSSRPRPAPRRDVEGGASWKGCNLLMSGSEPSIGTTLTRSYMRSAELEGNGIEDEP